jgi:hydroxymethylbilane synthase
MRGRTLRLATRGSDLAIRQAAEVKRALEDRRHEVELVEVETTGDQIQDELIHRLGKTGAFVRSLDEKVIDGDVDAAVHSMKDMPTEHPDGLIVAGVPQRESSADVLLTPDGTSLADLPEGATVGTSSLRRGAQLLAERPELDVQPLRGNVDTRVEKLLAPHLQEEHERRIEVKEARDELGDDVDPDDADIADLDPDELDVEDVEDLDDADFSSESWFDDLSPLEQRAMERDVDTTFDAIVLAEAGLRRIGLLHHLEYERLPTAQFVPAPGQGALAITTLDDETADLVNQSLDHPPTRIATTVERTILSELGGGCVAPIGISAELSGEHVTTTVRVLDRDGEAEVRATRDMPVERHARAARAFAQDLASQGAADLIEQARRTEDEETEQKR